MRYAWLFELTIGSLRLALLSNVSLLMNGQDWFGNRVPDPAHLKVIMRANVILNPAILKSPLRVRSKKDSVSISRVSEQ